MTNQAGNGQHTPGPWHIEDRAGDGRPIFVHGERFVAISGGHSDLDVAYVPQRYTGDRDCARLIAAAPMVLKALRACDDFLEDWAQGPAEVVRGRRYYPLPARVSARLANLLAQARAAIRLAEGG